MAFKKNCFALLSFSFFITNLFFNDAYATDSSSPLENQQEDSGLISSPLIKKNTFFQPTYEYFQKKIKAGSLPFSAYDINLLQS